MLILLLFQEPYISLGPWGTVTLTVLAVILALISWKQRTWKSTADASIAEMNVHKEAADRLRSINGQLVVEVANLKSQTDLHPLIEAINSWVSEGRQRFESAEKQLTINTSALKSMVEEMQAQRRTTEDHYSSINSTLMSHALEDKDYQLRFVTMMDSVERRLSDIAVKVGIAQWSVGKPSVDMPAESILTETKVERRARRG